MKQRKEQEIIEKTVKIVLIATTVIGLILTLFYIFYTSTIMLTSDSVITDVISHQQIIKKEFLLSTWYYGNEFWIFSLSIPTFLLSHFIKNNILVRQISVLITALIFFIILYKYGKKFLSKKETLFLIIIFLTGISYSVLDYFYAFNAYLTVIINSMLTLYIYYKSIETKEKKYYILALILTFLINMGSIRYFPSITLPFIITEIILLIIENKKVSIKQFITKNKKSIFKIIGIFIIAIIGLVTFYILTKIYHYEQRAGSLSFDIVNPKKIVKTSKAVFECISNFFGYDNANHPLLCFVEKKYFISNHRNYPLISFFTFTNIIKILVCILFMVVAPIMLYKNYKKNDKKINFLLIFNTISWFIMLYLYFTTTKFLYNRSELKYFLLNMILNMILGIYFIFKYLGINKKRTYIIDIFLLLYIISNLYTTFLTIKDNNDQVMKDKYELVNILKENNLTYGYAGFWNGLITNYLSNYEITIAGVEFNYSINKYKWYSDSNWYYHNGKTFLVIDKSIYKEFNDKGNRYSKSNKKIVSKNYVIYIYNKNPFNF